MVDNWLLAYICIGILDVIWSQTDGLIAFSVHLSTEEELAGSVLVPSHVNQTEAVDLAVTFSESELWGGVQEQLQTLSDNMHNRRRERDGGRYATGFLWQLMIVTFRSFVNLLRNPMISFFQV